MEHVLTKLYIQIRVILLSLMIMYSNNPQIKLLRLRTGGYFRNRADIIPVLLELSVWTLEGNTEIQ